MFFAARQGCRALQFPCYFLPISYRLYREAINMSMLATGKICFTTEIYGGSYDDMSFFIQEKANKNKIGINLGTNISNNAKEKCKSKISSDRFMIFELTESAWCCYSGHL
jgi:hypothetical protein